MLRANLARRLHQRAFAYTTLRTSLMKVCLVTPYDLSLEGGVNKHVFGLADSLRAHGDHVEVIGPKSDAAPEGPSVTTFGGVVSIQHNESDNRIGIFTSPLAVRRYMKSR